MRSERGFSRERGFSLLEILIVVVIVSVLFVVAIDRLLRARYEAERAMVESVIGALKSALYIDFAAAAARNQLAAMEAAGGSNPMLRLAEKPPTYAGEFYGPAPGTFEPGTWYFDSRERVLVYVLRFPERFTTSLEGPPRVRLKVEPDYEDTERNGRFDPGRDPVRGLKLVPAEPFYWK